MTQIKLTLYKKNGKKVVYPLTDKIRRLLYRADLGNYEKMHIYASDGKGINHLGKSVVFYNDTYAYSPKEARDMITYFWEG